MSKAANAALCVLTLALLTACSEGYTLPTATWTCTRTTPGKVWNGKYFTAAPICTRFELNGTFSQTTDGDVK